MTTYRFIQRFKGGGRLPPPPCNFEDCRSRAVGTWTNNETGKSPDLCETHRAELGAPEMTEGVEYAPTMTLCDGYYMSKGKITKMEKVARA